MSQLFDVIMIVDWSASATPKVGADSIWIHELDTARRTPTAPQNPRTRALAVAHLLGRLRHHTGRRVLVGCDFAFGYPAGFAAAAGLVGAASPVAAWEATWLHLAAAVRDDDRNRNNRWEVAAHLNRRLGSNHFWGVPATRAGTWLAATRPVEHALPAFRSGERRLATPSGRHPFSVWQLLGAGAVGSQTLMGIPVLQRTRRAPGLVDRVRVWPFETGFTEDPCGGRSDAIVLAEVWPSAIDVGHVEHPIKDARQVMGLSGHLAAEDSAGRLGRWFDPTVSVAERLLAISEEGWMLSG